MKLSSYSIFTLLMLGIGFTTLGQSDTIYFKPIHPAISDGSVIIGLQAMAPSYVLTGDNAGDFNTDFDFAVKAGVFLEKKNAIGGSMLSSRYSDKNDIKHTMYLYGGFMRLYQKDDTPNYFLELGINYGRKQEVIANKTEVIDKKVLGDLAIGWVWIDDQVMLEASMNFKFLNHSYLDLNTFAEQNNKAVYVQPHVSVFFFL